MSGICVYTEHMRRSKREAPGSKRLICACFDHTRSTYKVHPSSYLTSSLSSLSLPTLVPFKMQVTREIIEEIDLTGLENPSRHGWHHGISFFLLYSAYAKHILSFNRAYSIPKS